VKRVWRAVTEVGFIVFLFYSNLLMGVYERSGAGQSKGFLWALEEVFTFANLLIAIPAAFVGYLLIETFRKKI
jgi:hypothetical protein